MKHMQSDKQTIAWFKIAECVSRGEKERALGVYRLLSHSFNDNAVAFQLEADIYLSFDEQHKAVDLYHHAIKAYQKTGRLLEAVAICEHLLTITPNDFLLRKNAIHLFKATGIGSKVAGHMRYLVEFYAQKNQWEEIKILIAECESFCDPLGRVTIYEEMIIVLHGKGEACGISMWCLEKSIDALLIADNERQVQEFLGLIQALDDSLYKHVTDYLKHTI
jgi:hypothetical protein